MASKTITNAAAIILPPNGNRVSFVIQNEDTSIDIFIKKERGDALTVSTTDHDHRLGPGDSIGVSESEDGTEATRERWTIIAASGTPRVSFFENESIRR